MPEHSTAFVTVLCTGQLIKFDMAVNALKEAGIAHQVRAETATGLRLAMSAAPCPWAGKVLEPTRAYRRRSGGPIGAR
jgi:hypothetical protein